MAKKQNSKFELEKNLEKVKTKMNKMFSGFKLKHIKFDDIGVVNQELNKEIDILNNYANDTSKIFTHTDGYDALIFIGKSIFNFEINLKELVAKGFVNFVSNLTWYFYEKRNGLNFNIDIDPYEAEHANDLNEKHIQALSYLLYITNKLENVSNEFRLEFIKKQGLKAYIGFLTDHQFVQANKNAIIKDPSENPLDLFDYITLNIDCLRSTCDDYKHLWNELKSVSALFSIAKAKPSTLFDAYKTISYIVDDKQIESIKEVNLILKSITKILMHCRDDFNEDLYDRKTIEMIFKGKPLVCKTQMYTDDSISVKMIGLLECLYKLSLNDKIKNELYFKSDMKSCLQTIITKGNFIEIYFSLKLLAQLSFNETIKKDLAKSNDFQQVLNDLSKKDIHKINNDDDRLIYLNIKSLLEQIKWNSSEKSQINKLEQENNEHIMISYNKACKEVCLKIKDKLESNGLRVWLHQIDIHGSGLDAVTKAVENSSCVLMTITEKYRQSINCQLEAQYAFRLNKKIIPLVFQYNYENVLGWLGALIKGKKMINFMNNEYGECIKQLNDELVDVKTLAPLPPPPPPPSIPISTPQVEKHITNSNSSHVKPALIEEWTEAHVKEWFLQNNLPLNIFEYFKPCNGKILKQLSLMKKSSPNFYYESFKEIKNIKFNIIVLFSSYLDELFK